MVGTKGRREAGSTFIHLKVSMRLNYITTRLRIIVGNEEVSEGIIMGTLGGILVGGGSRSTSNGSGGCAGGGSGRNTCRSLGWLINNGILC